MRTVQIPEPVWATPADWFTSEADSFTDLDDEGLLHSYRRLIGAELVCADQGRPNPELVKVRRWAEWCIGQRLGDGMGDDGKPVDPPPAFAHMTREERGKCRRVGELDGDALYEHLRTAGLNDVSRAACLRAVRRGVA